MHRRHDRRQAVPTHSADEAEYGPARARAPVTLTALDTEGAHAVLSAAAAQLGAAVTLLRERDPLVAEARPSSDSLRTVIWMVYSAQADDGRTVVELDRSPGLSGFMQQLVGVLTAADFGAAHPRFDGCAR